MFSGKTLVDFTSLFSAYDFEKKWNYNSELHQWWMKSTQQTWLIKQNTD